MSSPSTVVTQGYGSFGSVSLLPTIGFGSGSSGGGNTLGLPVFSGPPRISVLVAGSPDLTPNLTVMVAPPVVEVIAPPPYRQFPDPE